MQEVLQQTGDVLAKVWVSNEEQGKFKEEYFEKTSGNYTNFRIKFNNFEINFNKRLPNFKKYDTIETNKKLKLFSNFYLPIELKKITYKEKNLKYKKYTEEELSTKLQEEIKTKLLKENKIDSDKILQEIPVITPTSEGLRVKLTIVYEEEIGIPKVIS